MKHRTAKHQLEKENNLNQLTQQNKIVMKTIITSDALSDEQKEEILSTYPIYYVGTPYLVGDIFNYEGKLYEVIQAHTSQADWRPNAVESLYKQVLSVETEETEIISDFVQPTGGHDAYQKGDKFRFKGDVYEVLIDNFVWNPETYPAGVKKL